MFTIGSIFTMLFGLVGAVGAASIIYGLVIDASYVAALAGTATLVPANNWLLIGMVLTMIGLGAMFISMFLQMVFAQKKEKKNEKAAQKQVAPNHG